MNHNTKTRAAALFSDESLDRLLGEVRHKSVDAILRESGLVAALKKQLAESLLSAELNLHLAMEAKVKAKVKAEVKAEVKAKVKAVRGGERCGNHRNGSSTKSVITPGGELELDIPRDRLATFEPQLLPKYQRRLPGFDYHIIGLYARGLDPLAIRAHILSLYRAQVPPGFISSVAAEVRDGIDQWQMRQLGSWYPVVCLDALRLNLRDTHVLKTRTVYAALGVRVDGRKEVLGLWLEQAGRTGFRSDMFDDLKCRGLQDILAVVGDPRHGYGEAMQALYPQAQLPAGVAQHAQSDAQNDAHTAHWKGDKRLPVSFKRPDRRTPRKERAPRWASAGEESGVRNFRLARR